MGNVTRKTNKETMRIRKGTKERKIHKNMMECKTKKTTADKMNNTTE